MNANRKIELLRRFRSDNVGAVTSTELVLLAVIVLIGLIVGIVAARDAMISELADVTGSVQDMNQSFSYNGAGSPSGQTSGASFSDALDECDEPEDVSGQAESGIVFDGPPVDERDGAASVSQEGLVVRFDFDGNAVDSSPFGDNNDGRLRGDAYVDDGVLYLDGNGDFVMLNNSNDINLQAVTQRTIYLEFTADDVTGRQVLYEEGGTVRGLNIYIEGGQLYAGVYNLRETVFSSFLSTGISAGQAYSVALRLDASGSIQPNAVTGFINGAAFGTAAGAQVYGHPGGIGLGGLNNATVFHDGAAGAGTGFGFAGQISSFRLYNRALDDTEVLALSN